MVYIRCFYYAKNYILQPICIHFFKSEHAKHIQGFFYSCAYQLAILVRQAGARDTLSTKMQVRPDQTAHAAVLLQQLG